MGKRKKKRKRLATMLALGTNKVLVKENDKLRDENAALKNEVLARNDKLLLLRKMASTDSCMLCGEPCRLGGGDSPTCILDEELRQMGVKL